MSQARGRLGAWPGSVSLLCLQLLHPWDRNGRPELPGGGAGMGGGRGHRHLVRHGLQLLLPLPQLRLQQLVLHADLLQL